MSDLQQRFHDYCRARAANVVSKYSRWLETHDGFDCQQDYCVDCVEIQRYVERHNKTGFTKIRGWDDRTEVDSVMHCDRCGVRLKCSLTDCGMEQEIEYLLQDDHLTDEDCYTISDFLDGFGCYDDGKYWPLIAPHAERLMAGMGDYSFRESEMVRQKGT